MDVDRRSRVVVTIYEVFNKIDAAEPDLTDAEVLKRIAEGLAATAAVLEVEPLPEERILNNRQWRLRG
jgi:hypothetical protein